MVKLSKIFSKIQNPTLIDQYLARLFPLDYFIVRNFRRLIKALFFFTELTMNYV